MKPFLHRIAEKYYKHYENSLHELTFVFPNRRAGIFFQHHLSNIAQNPIFSPQITTIDNCFIEASGLQMADKLSMLFKLYRNYIGISKSTENFDKFVYWGEIILADFNEIDKYRIDAKQLFTNLKELRELTNYEEIFSEEQRAAIEQFWINFDPTQKNEYRENFLQTWEILFPLYENFKAELIKENMGYDGMIARHVIEQLESQNNISWFDNKYFIFIGFNALNPCEKALMSILNKRKQADFYWDYEAYTLTDKNNPASLFYLENITKFKSKFDVGVTTDNTEEKHIELYRIPSSIGQAKQVYRILNDTYSIENNEQDYLKTAVVVPDEHLMLPIIYSIPQQIAKINVTMGYPLQLTSIAGLMDHIFELHKRKKLIYGELKFYHLTVRNIINHPFITLICGDMIDGINKDIISKNLIYIDKNQFSKHNLLKKIFNPDVDVITLTEYLIDVIKILVSTWNALDEKPEDHQLESSFLYQYYITINRIDGLLKANLDVMPTELDTLVRLIKQLSSSINIPFVGEPLNGLQIMGTLETRGLDFENIILTSFDEGVYPKHKFSNSFIPYNLRKGFDLPTFEHQDAITAYNFYQIFNRAKNIFFISDSRAEKTNSGELSRFFYQLKYHYQYDIKETLVNYDVSIQAQEPLSIKKSTEIQHKLQQFFRSEVENNSSALSASSINEYIRCPLKFYFRYIEKINTPDEVSESPEANVFGSIFHEVMAAIYKPFKNREITADLLTAISKNDKLIETHIKAAFAKNYFKIEPNTPHPELTGNNLLISNVIKKYVKGVLKQDLKYTPFIYVDSEKKCQTTLNTKYGQVNIKGYIDRVDLKNNIIRLIDYKTGKGELTFNDWDKLFNHHQKPKNQADYILQLLVYGLLYKKEAKDHQIQPNLIYTQKIFDKNFTSHITLSKQIEVLDYAEVEKDFILYLTACIEDILNPDLTFFQTTEHETCTFCDFKLICKR